MKEYMKTKTFDNKPIRMFRERGDWWVSIEDTCAILGVNPPYGHYTIEVDGIAVWSVPRLYRHVALTRPKLGAALYRFLRN